MKKIILISFLLMFFPLTAGAIPTLGVASGPPGSGGIYYGPIPNSGSYQWVFADDFVGGVDGFAMPGSGNYLSIWYGSDNGIVDKDVDVWLATTSLSGDDFEFAGVDFLSNDNLSKAAYKVPVYGVNLGSINNPKIGAWSLLTDGEFGTGTKEFWVLTDIIEYSGFETGDWMYAAILGNNKVIDFSPKTTSATIPEPVNLVLLGSSLIVLSCMKRKLKK